MEIHQVNIEKCATLRDVGEESQDTRRFLLDNFLLHLLVARGTTILS